MASLRPGPRWERHRHHAVTREEPGSRTREVYQRYRMRRKKVFAL
jgi:hypothetical protein